MRLVRVSGFLAILIYLRSIVLVVSRHQTIGVFILKQLEKFQVNYKQSQKS